MKKMFIVCLTLEKCKKKMFIAVPTIFDLIVWINIKKTSL